MSSMYPKAKYRLDKQGKLEACTVDDAAKEKALGKGWYDNPAELGVETHPSAEDRTRRERDGKDPNRFDAKQKQSKPATKKAAKTARKRK